MYCAFYYKFQLEYFQGFFIFNFEMTIVHRGCSMNYAMTASTITPLFLKAVTLHVIRTILILILTVLQTPIFFCFSIYVFFHGYSKATELQGKGEGISSTPHNHFHLLRRHFRHKPGDDWRELTSPHK